MGSGAERKTLSFSRSGLAASLRLSRRPSSSSSLPPLLLLLAARAPHSRTPARLRSLDPVPVVHLSTYLCSRTSCALVCVRVSWCSSVVLARLFGVFADIVVVAVIVAFPSHPSRTFASR